ncbi:MAG: two-component system, NtrC family, response regulator AtoC [Frankiaceae bacterium]|nr:two-component system, NtrC family, response regulator AtoC [Frankiaceae bacterium]
MSLHLLLVDDEPGMLETLSDILTSAGYDVTAVNNGDTALEHLLRGGYDLVLMDVRMPGRDGVAVLTESGAPPPPVVLMTAYALEERLIEARAGGVHAVLQKPFPAPYLLDVLAGAVAA